MNKFYKLFSNKQYRFIQYISVMLLLCSVCINTVMAQGVETEFPCYAVSENNSSPNTFIVYDPLTDTWTDIGDSGGTLIEAIAFNPNGGVLYGADAGVFGTFDIDPASPTYGQFNPCASVGTGNGALGAIALDDIDGMAWNPCTQTLFATNREGGATANDLLFQIDPVTCMFVPNAFGAGVDYVPVQEVFDGTVGSQVYDIDDIAVNPCTCDLFAISNQGGIGGVLTVIDQANGQIDQVVCDFGADDMEGLTFSPLCALYGSTGNGGATPNSFYEIGTFANFNDSNNYSCNETFNGTISSSPDIESIACLTAGPPDLALNKILAPGQTPINPGDDITFNINIFNQGAFDAYDVELIDYLPSCFVLNDPNWVAAGGNATLANPIPFLAAGASTTVPITVTITAACNSMETNFAEITEFSDPDGDPYFDTDSDPDSDNTNDGTPIDNEVNDPNDEDDHDPETIIICNLTATATGVDPLCNGEATGTATAVPAGGTAPFTYSWAPSGGSNMMATGLAAGTYTVTIVDANGCEATASVTLTDPPALSGSAVPTPVSCTGGTDGTIDLTPAGGTPGYTYTWSDGNTMQDRTGMAAGNYSVTITDANGCTTLVEVTITEPQPIAIEIEIGCEQTFDPGCDAILGYTVTGGTAAYTIVVTDENGAVVPPSAAGPAWTTLCDGQYDITVTDANNCETTESFVVCALTCDLTLAQDVIVDVSCFGGADGSASVTGTSSFLPITYTWEQAGAVIGAGTSISGLTAGVYKVIAVDNVGCTEELTLVIDEPQELVITDCNSTPVTTVGGSDGTAEVFPSGGTPMYTYSWSDGQTTNPAVGLTDGTYTVTVTDANGCEAQILCTVQPVLCDAFDANANVVDVLCNGDSNGEIDVTVLGAQGAVTYVWSPAVSTTSSATGLAAGMYTIMVSDAAGCEEELNVTIIQPSPLTAEIDKEDVSCDGFSDGSLDLQVSGGTEPYTFSWNNGPTSEDQTNVGEGTYTVTVTDANGCEVMSTVTIVAPPPLVATAIPTDVLCNGGSDGTIDLMVMGGTMPYTFAWSDGFALEDRSAMPAGNYSVLVTDANGCEILVEVTIEEPDPLVLTVDESCEMTFAPGCDAILGYSVSGGTPTYTITVTDAAGAVVAPDVPGAMPEYNTLCAGQYDITVVDANGCETTESFIICELTCDLTVDVGTIVNVTCFNGADGSAMITATSSNAPITYQWEQGGAPIPGATTNTITGLVAGVYKVVVMDAVGCVEEETITILEPEELVFTDCNATGISAIGVDDGTAEVFVTGGTPAYTYAWSDGQTTNPATGLGPGTYTVTITDANGCTTDGSCTIQPIECDSFDANANITPLDCNGDADAVIVVTVLGATGAITYTWTPAVSTSNTATGLAAGTYTILAADAVGCEEELIVNITEPTALTGEIDKENITCAGEMNGTLDLQVSGGTQPYTFAWADGPTTEDRSGLGVGSYSVVVTDANGCTITVQETIIAPPPIDAAFVVTDVLCDGDSNGAVNITVSGGTPQYTFEWSNGATTEDISGVPAGNYSVLVRDANGCSILLEMTIEEPLPLSLSVEETCEQTFAPGCDAVLAYAVSGGTPNYTITVTDAAGAPVTPDVAGAMPVWNSLCAGQYDITVVDANGCETTESFIICELSCDLELSLVDQIDVSCFGLSDGSITISGSSSNTPITYTWTQNGAPIGQTGTVLTGLAAGVYKVTAIDAVGCEEEETVVVEEPTELIASDCNSTQPSTLNGSDGTATVTVGGGTAPYSYSWSNGQTTNPATGLAAGTYTANVTDANGCTTQITCTVQPLTCDFDANANKVDVLCNGDANGSIDVTVIGGTMPFTYTWSPPVATGASATGLAAGSYEVLVVDAALCQELLEVVIAEPTALSAEIDKENVICNGLMNGTLDLQVSGGTQPYTFVWNNGPTTEDQSNLGPGTYTVTVTDANGCTIQSTAVITEPAPLDIEVDVVDILCAGDNDGTVTVNASGGTAPYTYSWNTGATTNTLTGAPAGQYTVTVTDINNCSLTENVTVFAPTALVLDDLTIEQPTCTSLSSGSATVVVSGGTTPYTYTWSAGSTTDTQTGLGPGMYFVIIKDANDCELNVPVTIEAPEGCAPECSDEIDVFTIEAPCGENTGSAQVFASGDPNGTIYTYTWSDGQTGVLASNLAPGLYSVSIVAGECTYVRDVAVGTNDGPTAEIISVTEATCNQTATATFNITSGTGSYTINFTGPTSGVMNVSGGLQLSFMMSGLQAGTYFVELLDNGTQCTDIIILEVLEGPEQLIVAGLPTDPTTCGTNTGQIDVNVSGGTAPYDYYLNGVVIGAGVAVNTYTYPSLNAGSYTVLVVDGNGCIGEAIYELSDPGAVVNPADFVLDQPVCSGEAGSVTPVNLVAGNAYAIINSAGGVLAQLAVAGMPIELPAGNYTIECVDVNGCTAALPIEIENEFTPITVEAQVEPETCQFNDGQVNVVFISGGSPPYNVTITNFSGSVISNPAAVPDGIYTITVVDANGCTLERTVTVDPGVDCMDCNDLVDSFVIEATCNMPDGSALVSASGDPTGTLYTYTWSDGQVTNLATGLMPGIYTVVIDAPDGCTYQELIAVGTINGPSAILEGTVPSNCIDTSGGAINLNITAGIGPFTITYTGPSIGGTTAPSTGPVALTGLPAGTYSIEIVDQATGCIDSVVEVVVEDDSTVLTVEVTDVGNSTCDNADGTVTVSVIGGSPFYTYYLNGNPIITTGATSYTFQNLQSGGYVIDVIDSGGCTGATMSTISDLNVPPINPNQWIIMQPQCPSDNGSATITAEVPITDDIQYNAFTAEGVLAGNFTAENPTVSLPPGMYYISCMDVNMCESTYEFIIDEDPEPLTFEAQLTDPSGCDEDAGTITVVFTDGGTPPYTTSVIGAGGVPITNLAAVSPGTYFITVTDANDCSLTREVVISDEFLSCADVSLVKTVSPTIVEIGDVVTWTIVVMNDGFSEATGVTVLDDMPSCYTYVSDDAGGNFNPATGIWTVGSIPVNGSMVLNIDATVICATDIVNVAEVATQNEDDPDSDPGNGADNDGDGDIGSEDPDSTQDPDDEDDGDDAFPTILTDIDLSLVKTVAPTMVVVGDDLIWTVVVTNDGPATATNVTVQDNLPSCFTYVSDNSGGNYDPVSGVWSVGVIPVGGSVAIQITSTAICTTDIINVAEVSGADQPDVDSTPGNGADTDGDGDIGSEDPDGTQDPDDEDDGDDAVPVVVPPVADVELVKFISPPVVQLGDQVIFSVQVSNSGPQNATGLTVLDQLPSCYTYLSDNQGTYDPVSGIWDIGTLPVGQTVLLQIFATINCDTDITNVAEVYTQNETDTDSTPGNGADTDGDGDIGPSDPDGSQDPDDEDDGDDATPLIDVPAIDLSLVKTIAPATANIGDDVTFTVLVTNAGPDDATGVSILDQLPSSYAYVSDSGAGAYDPVSGLWTVPGTIAAGASVSLQITATILDYNDVVNIAHVETADQPDTDSTPGNPADTDGDGDIGSEDPDSNQDPNDEDDGDDAFPTPFMIDLDLVKTVQPSVASVGDNIFFTIEVGNNGPGTATGVTVLDNLPSGAQYVGDNSGGTYNPVSGIWTVGTIPVGGTAMLQIEVTVLNFTDITNIAEVNGADQEDTDSTPGNGADTDGDGDIGSEDPDDTQDPDDEDDGDDATPMEAQLIDLELVKTASPTSVNFGDVVTFTIVVVNEGPVTATNVVVQDNLPVSYVYQSDNSGGAFSPTTGLWNVGTIPVGGSATLTIDATVVSVDDLVNIAEVYSADQQDIDSNPGNGADTDGDGDIGSEDPDGTQDPDDEDDGDDAVVMGPVADLELAKSVDATVVEDGDQITWTLTLTNQGPQDATGVTVQENLPSSLSYVGDNSGGTFNPGTGIWTVGSIAAGQTTSIQITTQVLSIGEDGITNFAQVATSDQPDVDSTPGNDTDGTPDEDEEAIAIVFPVPPVIDLEIIKMVTPPVVDVCGTVSFVIDVFNNGPDPATGVVVMDLLPDCAEFISDNTDGVFYDPTTGIWEVGFVPVGAIAQLVINAKINCDLVNVAEIIAHDQDDIDSTPNNGYDPDGDGNIGSIDDDGTQDLDEEDDADDAAPTVVNTSADLSLVKSVNPTTASVGDNVIWTITVTNDGPNDATGVTVSDNLPAGLNYVSDNSSNAFNPNTGIWNIGNLANGASTSIEIETTVGQAGTFVNSAEIASSNNPDFDSTPNNNVASEDDQDDATITVEDAVCLPPVGPDTIDAGCIDPITPTEICIPFSDPNGGNVTITDIDHTFECSIVQLSDDCIQFTPLPAFDGSTEITVTYCNDCGECASTIIYAEVACDGEQTVIDLGCLEPITPVDVCLPLSDNESISEINALFDCSIVQTSDDCFMLTPLPGYVGLLELEVVVCNDNDPTDCETISVIGFVDCDSCTATAASIELPDGSDAMSICVDDDVEEPIDAQIADAGAGENSAWVITDLDGNILALPDAPPFILDGAPAGTCLIWYLNWDGDLDQTPAVGDSAVDIVTASNCASLSNPITVIREVCEPCETEILIGCTEQITPVEFCPEFCLEGAEIVDATTLYNCSINISPDGDCLTYTPLPGLVNFVDTITVEACNDAGQCEIVEIQVTTVEDIAECDDEPNAPMLTNDEAMVDEGGNVTIDVLGNDEGCVEYEVTIVEQPENGTATVNADGSITYEPNAGFTGTESFDYQVCCAESGLCEVATVSVTVNATAENPTATDDAANVDQDGTVTIDLIGNDEGCDEYEVTLTSDPANGSVTVDADGNATYTPDAGFNGTDAFDYQICCVESGLCDEATVTITVDEVAAECTAAVDDNVMTASGTPITIEVLSNDTGDNLEATDVSDPSDGTAVIFGNDVVYVPDGGFTGTDCFDYTVTCENGETDTGTICVDVIENSAPEFNPNVDTIYESIPINDAFTYCLDANDVDGDPITFSIIENGMLGTAVLDANNCIVYTAGSIVGLDEFIVVACDNLGNCDTLVFIVDIFDVNEPNNPPVINGDTLIYTIEQDTQLDECISVVDADGDPIDIDVILDPENGTVVFDGECFVYTPDNGFIGVDTIEVIACDDEVPPLCDTVVLIINVVPSAGNNPPVANDDVYVIMPNTQNVFNILDNDSDVDENDIISICAITDGPTNGTLVVSDDSLSVTYTPDPGFVGVDSFQYVIKDLTGLSDTAWAIINVELDEVINAVDDSESTDMDTPVEINVLGNDEGVTIKLVEIGTAANGTVTFNSDSTAVIYTPNDGYVGTDTFSYVICDMMGNLDTALVTVDINEIASPPCSYDIPSGISPNGDGINDAFNIVFTGECENSTPEVCIFNRWGNYVYQVDNYTTPWDGTWQENGNDVPDGTYYYTVVFDKDDASKNIAGYLEVRR